MKKTLLSFILIVCSAAGIMAATRTLYQAQQSATAFVQQQQLQQVAQTPAYYVFNRPAGQGFVIVSADDRMPAILGYADTGSFDSQQLPPNFEAWLERYARQLASAEVRGAKAVTPRHNVVPVSPMLDIENIKWGQSAPFNDSCPRIGTTACPTGCVPTAAAQMMRYYKFPASGRGDHSYTWNGTVRAANFAARTYPWNTLPGKYTSSATTAQKKAVAQLMYDLGVACEVKYGVGGSSANMQRMAKALVNYFRYDPNLAILPMDLIGPAVFDSIVEREIRSARPVFLSGSTSSGGGHAFICDGIDENGLFHINWGWGGLANGYFLMNALEPDVQGEGGSTGGYTEDIDAVIGVQPSTRENDTLIPPQLYVRSLQLASARRLARNDYVEVVLQQMTNYGMSDWQGTRGVYICDGNGQPVTPLRMMNGSLKMFYYSSPISIYRPIPATLAPGTYRLYPYFTDATHNDTLRPMDIMYGSEPYLEFTLTADSVLFGPAPTSVWMSDLSATVNSDETVTFEWDIEDLAPAYVVEVLSGSLLVSSDTVWATDATVRFYYKGTYNYSWRLKALDEDNNLLDMKNGDDFVVTVTTDYTPANLTCTLLAPGQLRFSWRGNAPGYQYEISYNGNVQLRTATTANHIDYPYTASYGTFTWWVRALNPMMNSYVSDAANAVFTYDASTPTGTEETAQPAGQNGKQMEKGVVRILHDGKAYDVTGKIQP